MNLSELRTWLVREWRVWSWWTINDMKQNYELRRKMLKAVGNVWHISHWDLWWSWSRRRQTWKMTKVLRMGRHECTKVWDLNAPRCRQMDIMDCQLGRGKLHPSRGYGDRTKVRKALWRRPKSSEYSVPFPTAVQYHMKRGISHE